MRHIEGWSRRDDEQQPFRLGSELGSRYNVIRKLGEGGFASVYLVQQEAIGRLCAAKVTTHDNVNYLYHRHLLREARFMAMIDHPCVCPVLDAIDTESLAWYVMPWYARGSLLTQLEQNRNVISEIEMIDLFYSVTEGLAAIHKCGIVHGDIKPDNIVIGTNGRPVIIDFGIANHIGSRIPCVAGTAEYLAPEVFEVTYRSDPRVDLYALGCVFFQVFTGKMPFRRKGGVSTVLRDHAKGDRPNPRKFCPDIRPSISELITRLMARWPEDRPSTAMSVLRDISNIRDSLRTPLPVASYKAQFSDTVRTLLTTIGATARFNRA